MTNYKIWCDQCDEWVNEFDISNDNYICCSDCGNGLIMVTK